MSTPSKVRVGRSSRGLGGPLALGLLTLGLLPAGAFTLTNVTAVNVTPSSFSILFRTTTPTTPAIFVYADAAGTVNLAGSVGIEWLPLHTGDPSITDPWQRRQNLEAIRQGAQDRGLALVRISECQPGTTYHYRVQATDTQGQVIVWPASGPLPAVTTAAANSFMVDSRQLVIDLPGGDASGQVVVLSNTNSAYALAAVAGDGVGTNQVFFNLSDLLALSGGTNYVPLGNQAFTAQLPGRSGASATNEYSVSFTGQFVVGTPEAEIFRVQDAVALLLGRTVLRAGDPGRISLRAISTAGLTNLAFELDLPAGTLTNLVLQDPASWVGSASVQALSGTRSRLTFGAAPGEFLQGTQQVATLAFSTLPDQHSAFIPLRPAQLVATRGDATLVTNWFAQAGRVAVVGPEPLVELADDTAGAPSLLLYGKVGSGYQVQTTASLQTPVPWQNGPRVPLTNIVQILANGPAAGPGHFFRAYELPGDPPLVDASLRAGGGRDLTVFGRPGANYELQYATNLSGVVVWRSQLNYTLTNSYRGLTGFSSTNPVIFYRISRP
jgi:hypothetical protein